MLKALMSSALYRVVSCMFLIAGTCVGGGMLALPVSGGRVGFLPSLSIMIVAWLFMTVTGLFYVEISLWLREDAHIISMASKLLGKRARYLCWVIYLFIGYASLVAYTAEGGRMTGSFLHDWLPAALNEKIAGSFLYLLFFTFVLLLGVKAVTRLNALLFSGMVAVFVILIAVSSGGMQDELLWQQNWQQSNMLALFPLMLTTFSYPGLVPVLVSALDRNAKHARIAIVGGTTLTFLTYLIWLAVVMATVPYEGEFGLKEAYAGDHSATFCLSHIVSSPLFGTLAKAFGFLALTTSFIGIAWSLHHFLSDGLSIKAKGKGGLGLAALVVLPSFFFTVAFDKVFFAALEMTGGIGDSLISGLIPCLMIWVGRYHRGYYQAYRVWGGKALIFCMAAIALLVLSYEVVHRMGWG